MKIYIKFFTLIFLKSLLYVVSIMFSLIFILNLLTELEFFKEIEVSSGFPIFLSLLNSPSMIFEMLPFIFLITTQLFFIKLFNNNEIEIFKYSGLKNTSILKIFSLIVISSGIILTIIFYNFSAVFKNFYLEEKTKFTSDSKYLAVITKNGLWIKDEIDEKIYIVNSSKIESNFLINNFITEFDKDYKVIRNLKSDKINIQSTDWQAFNVKVYDKNNYEIKKQLNIKTNFDYKRIQTLYSNLSSLSFYQLFELRKNYKKLNYSLIEINLQFLKILSFPLYLFLVAIFSSLIMFRVKRLHNTTFKISLGLFFSVIIYYINNFFMVMGNTERISLIFAIFIPLILLSIINSLMLNKINEK
ncbi:LptF/LptG family permease [Candidatus Pelagibacter sp. HTCC7211]|uniref:LptF/LptG family permease n=1 Tax=Pelagibacter sp. (strain HTCC7211) TaxID=439493 RepID=UPI00032011BF|nr:LptF/LptG family permease [Candidatus Pelagibacter sp. HTCC7211]